MKFSLFSLLLFGLMAFTCTLASPISEDSTSVSHFIDRKEGFSDHTLANYDENKDSDISNTHFNGEYTTSTHSLTERDVKYPVQPDAALVAKIMVTLKAELYVKVFASITASFCEKVSASISAKASLLGGLISVGDVQLKLIQSAVIKKLQASFDAELKSKIQVAIYAELEILLEQLLGSSPLDEIKFLEKLTEFEIKARALVIAQLPKISAALAVEAKAQLEAAIKDVEVNLPLLAKATISAGINVEAALKVIIAVALEIAAKLDVKVIVDAILKSL
ncbi:hypothetical protein INT47_007067 [Mucor saturninus]|uniref:Uncharacterized protein n=1 Tax=Mucor saturninus TaxID=64648 RepID=A0A8H7R6B1_9FUNG|nr:hypothetical protein INT47_007067 [Mucor saturninus]